VSVASLVVSKPFSNHVSCECKVQTCDVSRIGTVFCCEHQMTLLGYPLLGVGDYMIGICVWAFFVLGPICGFPLIHVTMASHSLSLSPFTSSGPFLCWLGFSLEKVIIALVFLFLVAALLPVGQRG